MSWRDLVKAMEPGKKYYIDQLMRITNERGQILLALIRASGKNIESHNGVFQLTFDGEALRKMILNQQNNKNDA